MREGCRPISLSSEFGNFCSCLCQSTSLECLWWYDVDLSAHELKELVSALEQISSLKMVVYNDDTMLTDVGIRQVKQAMSSSTLIQAFNDGTFDKEQVGRSACVVYQIFDHYYQIKIPLPTLDLVTADMQASSHHSAGDEELQLALSASIQTAQDQLTRREGQQQTDDQELQRAIALSLNQASSHHSPDSEDHQQKQQLDKKKRCCIS